MELMVFAPFVFVLVYALFPRFRRKLRDRIWRVQARHEQKKCYKSNYPVRMEIRPRKGGW